MITVNPGNDNSFGTFLRQMGPYTAGLIGLLVAVLFWILAWYFLVPRLAGKNVPVKGLWRISLTYIAGICYFFCLALFFIYFF